jgi:hypothetical protein
MPAVISAIAAIPLALLSFPKNMTASPEARFCHYLGIFNN